MSDYREFFSFRQKTGSEITGTMRVHRYYYDAEQVESVNMLAMSTNAGSTSGTYNVQLVCADASRVTSTFIHRTIEIESSGKIVLDEYHGLSNFNPTSACAGYGYTAANNPVYTYNPPDGWNKAARPSGSIINLGGDIPQVFVNNPNLEPINNLAIVYCALYGDNEQLIDFLLRYGNKPFVKWTCYYQEKGGNFFKGYDYDFQLVWDINGIDAFDIDYSDCVVHLTVFDDPPQYDYGDIDGAPNKFIGSNDQLPFSAATTAIDLYCWVDIPWGDGVYSTDKCIFGFPKHLRGLDFGSILFTGKVTQNDQSTGEVVEGLPEEDEEYQPVEPAHDDPMVTPPDITDPISALSVGASTYTLTKAEHTNLIEWLWSSTFMDDIKLVNNNPMENIISCKLFPFTISGGTNQIVVIGNVGSTITGNKLSTYSPYVKVVDSYMPSGFYNNFLDLPPYTTATIYLPYVGIKQLDLALIYGKSMDVWYNYDVVSGSCTASIYAGGTVVAMYQGNIAIDLPLTGSNRAQLEASYVATTAETVLSVIGTVAGAAATGGAGAVVGAAATAGVIASGLTKNATAQFHSETTGSFSPNSWGVLSKQVVITYDRPTYQDIDTFNHTYGRMCGLSKAIGALRGFTQTSADIDLTGIPCTEGERDMIRNLLSSGFFI